MKSRTEKPSSKTPSGSQGKSSSRKPVRAADSVDRVYEAIKGFAVDYRFKPGERINEVELAMRLGVSRTPVREALNRLARDGFMSFVPNKGFYARTITPEGVRDLYELRSALERAAVRLACERGSDAEIEAIAKDWLGRSKAGLKPDWTKIAEADEAFHVAIARIARNARLLEALTDLNSLIRFFRRIDLESPRRRKSTYEEHAAIIDALRVRDANKGGDLMEKHVTLSSAHAVEVTKEGLARIFFGTAA
jgi:DNA-binding GntR family transcriptional regulator